MFPNFLINNAMHMLVPQRSEARYKAPTYVRLHYGAALRCSPLVQGFVDEAHPLREVTTRYGDDNAVLALGVEHDLGNGRANYALAGLY